MPSPHYIILVDQHDQPLDTMEKLEAHRRGILHRAFSVFIFNAVGDMLLQQRAAEKYHSPLLWTNACCSHPFPGEENIDAAQRRLEEELGFITPLQKIFHFTYRAEFENGLIEHEFDHVFIGVYDGSISPDPEEVNSYRYLSITDIQDSIEKTPEQYTPWFIIAFPMVLSWLEKNGPTIFNSK